MATESGNQRRTAPRIRRYQTPVNVVRRRQLAPAEIFVASFLALIVLGTICLIVLPGLYQGQHLGWTDAIFTATSAVCVTGLIVVDTANYFTTFGQVVLLILIQLGGLGMLVLTSVIITALGGRPSLQTETLAAGARHTMPHVPARKLILDVVRFTFFFEMLGTIVLYFTWAPTLGWGWREALWPALFHSVSAFCNAGFSTNSDSLMSFQSSPATLLIISLLINAGGLGFIAMEEIYLWFRQPNARRRRLSTHSKLVLLTTALLTFGGWAMFAGFEWNALLSEMSIVDKLSNSLFMSVTTRTAGFNSIDYASATDSSNFLTIILMMIGGAPGSTAGGMKTTTFAIIGLLAWSRLRSRSTVVFANRSIPGETIQRAVSLVVLAVGVVVAGTFALAVIGDFVGAKQTFLVRLFETVSALNTVGLSMGITPDLSVPSRWVVIALMFAGRTGPLAIAAVLMVRLSTREHFRLAYEDVVVG